MALGWKVCVGNAAVSVLPSPKRQKCVSELNGWVLLVDELLVKTIGFGPQPAVSLREKSAFGFGNTKTFLDVESAQPSQFLTLSFTV